ncbi:hypothetical protein ACKAV7_003771 [Fusarium commune]
MVSATSDLAAIHRLIGKWLPEHRPAIQQWIASKLKEGKQSKSLSLDPSLVAFQELVNSTPYWQALSNDMFTQSSKNYDPTGDPALRTLGDFVNSKRESALRFSRPQPKFLILYNSFQKLSH